MRRSLAAFPLVLLLAACQVSLPPGPASKSNAPAAAASRRPAAASPQPAAANGPAKNGASKSGEAIAASRLDVLAPPTTTSNKLVGVVRVDAAHLVASGAGRIAEQGGKQVLLAGGVDVVGGTGPGNRVGAIGTPGAAPRAALTAGGAFMAAGGGQLIGNDGSTLIGNDGSTLIGNDGSTYRLAQAPAPAAGPSTALPAANMLISVVSLRTREYLPLGQDAQGRPVYTVLSGADGGYEVFVPPGEERNVLIVAQIPGSTAPGLVLNALTNRDVKAQVDAGASSGTRLMRALVIERLSQILAAETRDAAILAYSSQGDVPPGMVPLVTDFVDYLYTLAQRLGVRRGEDPRVARALSQAMSDALLAMVDLGVPQVSTEVVETWEGPPAPALGLLDAYISDLHARAALYMADPSAPGGYRALDGAWLRGVNLPAPLYNGATPLPPAPLRQPDRIVRNPAELADFAIDEFLAVRRIGVWGPLTHLFNTLDGQAPYAEPGYSQNRKHINRLQQGLTILSAFLLIELTPGTADGTQNPPADRQAAAAAVAAALAFDLEAARAAVR